MTMERSLLDLPVTKLKAAGLFEPKMHVDSIPHPYLGCPLGMEYLLKWNKAVITNASH